MKMAATVLKRVRRSLFEIQRLLETENSSKAILLIKRCQTNLERIQQMIPDECYSTIHSSLEQLENICLQSKHNSNSYVAPRQSCGRRGRPQVDISRTQLILLVNEGHTAPQIASLLHCSNSTIYKKLYAEGIRLNQRYSTLSDADLFQEISRLRNDFPRAGSEMMCGYLRSQGLYVQRKRVRQILANIDPVGTALRWGSTVSRRVYSVASPNSLWHMDAHLKLSRWGFVTHGCIDGFSRMITYLDCATSITADTVILSFFKAVEKFGLPSRMRSDHGYENIFVALVMNCLRGLHRGSHITGKSVHNQRIERLWRDVRVQVTHSFYEEFLNLEDNGQLNVENSVHMYILQFIYLDEINDHLRKFQNAWNCHKIRTESRKTPRQLWIDGILSNMNSDHTAVHEIFSETSPNLLQRIQSYFGDIEDVVVVEENHKSRFTAKIDLSENEKTSLINIKMGPGDPKHKYLSCVRYLLESRME